MARIYTFVTFSHLSSTKDRRHILHYSIFYIKEKPRFDRDRIKLKLWEDIGKEFIGFYIIGDDDMEMDSQLIEDIQDEKEELSFLLYRVRITTFFSLPFLMSLLEYTKKNPGLCFL